MSGTGRVIVRPVQPLVLQQRAEHLPVGLELVGQVADVPLRHAFQLSAIT
jgi:hypothetical protein